MPWHETPDVEQWLAAVGDLLFAEPGVHSIALTQAQAVREGDAGTRFAWWAAGGDVTGAALWRAPYPALVSAAPDDALAELAQLWPLDLVSGETALACRLAVLDGRPARLVRAERLHLLQALHLPSVPGRSRVAAAGDLELVTDWFTAFLTTSNLPAMDVPATVADRVGRGLIRLWEVNGRPVALAGHQLPAFGGIRVGPVFTPPEHRQQGYGGAVTAAVTQQALEAGVSEVVLYTDVTNRTANRLYPRLGFLPVGERAVLQISSG